MRTSPSVRIGAVDIAPQDVEAAADVLRSGNLRQGPVTAAFEERFAERVGARHAVAVSSGTAALHLAYLGLFQPGDEVIVPAFTFVATATMLTAMGAVPVFADVDPRTFTLSVEDARKRIGPRTRGIVGVHLFGNACDVDAMRGLAGEAGLTLVWDAAQALGTEYRGRDIGSQPAATCFSFYPSKAITTGEGGMVVTDDQRLADALRLARSHGAAQKYLHLSLGFNHRLTDVQAALGLSQLERLDGSLERRRENARFLTSHLREIPGVIPPFVPHTSGHSFNQYCVLVDADGAGIDRDTLARRLIDRGVETAVHYPRPLHRQPLFARTSGDAHLPVSEDLCARILALPVHPKLDQADLEQIVRAVADAAG